jgi:hypothetical protein
MNDANGGPPPGFPEAPPAGASGPGYTQPGEPGFSPSFAPDGPLDGAAAGDAYVAPGSTVVEPFASPVAQTAPYGGAPYASAPIPPAGLGNAPPYGLGSAPAYGVAPAAAPAPRSSAPLVVGILAIVVAVTGAIGFVFYWRARSAAADAAAPADTIEVPEKKKSGDDDKKSDEKKEAAPAPTPAPTPSSEPTQQPSATKPEPSSPKPEPTTPKPQPTTQPKPQPTTQPKPEPTTQPKPQPKPQPTAQPKPQPTSSPEGGRRHIPSVR